MTGMLTAAMIPSIMSGIAHAGNAAGGADVGRDALEGHDGTGPGILGDLGVLGGNDVHDDAAFEHLGKAFLGGPGGGLGGHCWCPILWLRRVCGTCSNAAAARASRPDYTGTSRTPASPTGWGIAPRSASPPSQA